MGIWTALDANTNDEMTTTTAATVGLTDLHAVYRALPGRARRNASWLMNPLWLGAIRQLGSAVGASFSGDLRDPLAERILGKPAFEDDDSPATTTTTALDNVLVFGNFNNYVIVDRVGLTVELVPHLFGTNHRPTGARGLYAYWRVGGDVVGPEQASFRLLQDKTSA
jgi:HK97 family phage major capsid protein